MNLNDKQNRTDLTNAKSVENSKGQENPTESNSINGVSDAYFNARKGLEVDYHKSDAEQAASTIANEKKYDKKSDSYFESMQEHEIGDPEHTSPVANLKSENTKSLNKKLNEESTKINPMNEIKKTNSNDPKTKHEIGDPEKQKNNPKSDDTSKKPVTEADNMDRIDTIREHEIGDPEKITKEEISADDSLIAEKSQESNKLEDLKN